MHQASSANRETSGISGKSGVRPQREDLTWLFRRRKCKPRWRSLEMQIRSIRLKNVKSYGEGPDGNGITVSFQPGVNRVAGRNGHGKTTLIEALGYALFFSEPEHDETFKL